jgi:geranylgeranyl pyrophosphate synthase
MEGPHYKMLTPGVRGALDAVEKRITSLPESEFIIKELHSPSIHLLNGNAKLVRSALLFIVAEEMKLKPLDFVELAASVELLHTSSLIHDDIIDRDRERRGILTVHSKYGDEIAILAGNALISQAIQISSGYGTGVTSFIAKVAMEMCAGELLDYEYQKDLVMPNLKSYSKIAKLKCASLIAASCALVPLYKGNGKAQKELYKAGDEIGMAFQVRDDIMDYYQPDGKTLSERKVSGPNVVKALIKEKGLSVEDALTEAKELNGSYISSAKARLDGMGFKKLSGYVSLMAIA